MNPLKTSSNSPLILTAPAALPAAPIPVSPSYGQSVQGNILFKMGHGDYPRLLMCDLGQYKVADPRLFFKGYITILFEYRTLRRRNDQCQRPAIKRLFVIPPGSSADGATHGKDGLLIRFGEELFAEAAVAKSCIAHRKLLRSKGLVKFDLSDNNATCIEQILKSIAIELSSDHPERIDMIAIKLLELLIFCEGLDNGMAMIVSAVDPHPIIEQFNELLERSYTRERSVRYYADTLGIHPNHLNYLLKKHTRFNAKESINNRVVQRSKQLLAQSGLIIKEIAYQLGFDDPNNFSTFFQKYTGVSPVAFRSGAVA